MFYYIICNIAQESSNKVSFTLELFLSILAIIISIFSMVFEYYWSQKINKTNLEADFFKDIYGNYLMDKIPKARNMILYNNHTISDTDDLINVLNDIRHSSLFYKYNDKIFYDALNKELQKLEDELVKNSGLTFTDDDKYIDFINKINQDIENVYTIIMNKYIGK